MYGTVRDVCPYVHGIRLRVKSLHCSLVLIGHTRLTSCCSLRMRAFVSARVCAACILCFLFVSKWLVWLCYPASRCNCSFPLLPSPYRSDSWSIMATIGYTSTSYPMSRRGSTLTRALEYKGNTGGQYQRDRRYFTTSRDGTCTISISCRRGLAPVPSLQPS